MHTSDTFETVVPLTGEQPTSVTLFMTHPPMENRIIRLLGSPVELQVAR